MKVMYVLWPDKKYTASQRREVLLDICDKKIPLDDIKRLVINIDDEFSQVKSPAPKFHLGDSIVATLSVTAEKDIFADIFQLLQNAGFKVGQYVVEESIYKDYGDNVHFRVRDWPDGARTPTVVLAVTLLTRPKKYDLAEWIRRWHGTMSPGSEEIQPRARYVRNVVLSVEKDSPVYDGIVEESWPSAEHISDPYKFYLADTPLLLAKNMIKMLKLVTHFHQLHKIRTVTMSEYFLKTDYQKDK